mmetsp:Transcript_1843/g.6044  ORF Transcript_1843/g.6044 Transcript_1843/m.6044 type:complete len:264 (+) Transcript_1843:587-1378(+)
MVPRGLPRLRPSRLLRLEQRLCVRRRVADGQRRRALRRRADGPRRRAPGLRVQRAQGPRRPAARGEQLGHLGHRGRRLLRGAERDRRVRGRVHGRGGRRALRLHVLRGRRRQPDDGRGRGRRRLLLGATRTRGGARWSGVTAARWHPRGRGLKETGGPDRPAPAGGTGRRPTFLFRLHTRGRSRGRRERERERGRPPWPRTSRTGSARNPAARGRTRRRRALRRIPAPTATGPRAAISSPAGLSGTERSSKSPLIRCFEPGVV